MGRAGKLVDLARYYACEVFDEGRVRARRLTEDNLLIGRQEAALAGCLADEGGVRLIKGQAEGQYRGQIAEYLGVPQTSILLFYTAHAALSFYLRMLRRRWPERKRVLVAGFTCSVVVDSILAANCEPVFVDIETETFGLEFAGLEKALSDATGTLAVLHQHLFGTPAKDHDAILELCRRRGVVLIQDCAQAMGARRNGVAVGLDGDCAIFSSQASKQINSYSGGVLFVRAPSPEFTAEYADVPYPDEKAVERLLRCYVVQYRRKVVSRWALPPYLLLNRKKLVPSLHPTETQARESLPRGQKTIYVARQPNALCELGLIQLTRLEANVTRWLRHEKEIDAWLSRKGARYEGVRAAPLRVPRIADAEYKASHAHDGGYLVGKWFTYSYGDCPNARRMAACLVNYMKMDEEYVDL